jgi:hypothetical protein
MRNRLPLLALLLAPVLAHADETARPAAFPRGEEICFGRVYDAGHLKAHPDQRVTSFYLWHELTPDPPREYGDETADEKRQWDFDPNNRLLLDLMMHVRDRPDMQVQTFECEGDNASIFCGVDCDGGYFTAKVEGNSLTVTNQGFQFEGSCESGVGWLTSVKGDKIFRLDKLPNSACLAERESAGPSLAVAGPPLRERLDGAEPACYLATYDDAHLAADKEQSVTDIWLAKHGSDDFALGICQRGGECSEHKVECGPNTYSWSCFDPDNRYVESAEPGSDRTQSSPIAVLTRAGADTLLLRNHDNNMAKLLETKLGPGDDNFKMTLAADPNSCGAGIDWKDESSPGQPAH